MTPGMREVLDSLPALTDVRREHHATPKGTTRQREKGRKDRAEDKVKKAVRLECAARDGHCRLCFHGRSAWAFHFSGDVIADDLATERGHGGPSAWAHMHARRRSQTRNQAPARRHDTKYSLMLCQRHHDHYDGRAQPRLLITALSRKGANGALKFARGK